MSETTKGQPEDNQRTTEARSHRVYPPAVQTISWSRPRTPSRERTRSRVGSHGSSISTAQSMSRECPSRRDAHCYAACRNTRKHMRRSMTTFGAVTTSSSRTTLRFNPTRMGTSRWVSRAALASHDCGSATRLAKRLPWLVRLPADGSKLSRISARDERPYPARPRRQEVAPASSPDAHRGR